MTQHMVTGKKIRKVAVDAGIVLAETATSTSPAEQVVEARMVEPDPEPTNAQKTADGLRQVAAMIEQHPDLMEIPSFRFMFGRTLLSVQTKEEVAALIRAGKASGAKVKKHQDSRFAGVDLVFAETTMFEGVSLHVYVDREEICEKVVTGTHEVTEEVPDPEALAAVPTVMVIKTVEDVEWRCLPILADEPAALTAGAGA